MLRAHLKFHTITWVALLFCGGLFLWLNMEYSREAYARKVEQGWKGGVSFGFPLVLWDSGKYYKVTTVNNRLSLSLQDYGSFQPTGVAINVLCGMALLVSAGWVCERFRRRRSDSNIEERSQSPADSIRGRPVRLSTLVALAGLAGLGVWLNVQTSTRMEQQPNQQTMFHQTMGWPLTIYSASHPLFVKKGQPTLVRITDLQKLALLCRYPHWLYERSRWNELNIVGNIAILTLLLALFAAGMERLGRAPLKEAAPLVK